MDNLNFFNPQLQNLQTQMQSLQSLLSKPAPMVSAQSSTVQMSSIQAISFVDGLEGARVYLKNLPANSSAAVFDKEDAVFYTLSVDANGVPAPIKIGRFTLEEAPDADTNTITKQDFDAFKQEIRETLAAMSQRKRTVKKEAEE